MKKYDEIGVTLTAENSATKDLRLTFSLTGENCSEKGVSFYACLHGDWEGERVQYDFNDMSVAELDDIIAQFQLMRDCFVIPKCVEVVE